MEERQAHEDAKQAQLRQREELVERQALARGRDRDVIRERDTNIALYGSNERQAESDLRKDPRKDSDPDEALEEQKTDKALDQVPTVFQKPSTWSKDVSESRISHDMNRQMADKEQQLQAMEAEWVRERTRLNRTVERLEREVKVSQEREQVQQNQGRREAQRAQEELEDAKSVIAKLQAKMEKKDEVMMSMEKKALKKKDEVVMSGREAKERAQKELEDAKSVITKLQGQLEKKDEVMMMLRITMYSDSYIACMPEV